MSEIEYGIFSSKDIELIHQNFSDMQEVISKVLALLAKPNPADEVIKSNEIHLTRVNNKLVQLIQTIEDGVDIQNKEVLAEVKAITKNISNYPSDVTVKNMAQIPEWMQSDKSIKDLEKAIIQVQERIQESREPNQAPEQYTAVRRVVKQGNVLIFDDSIGGGGRGGGGGSASLGRFTYTDTSGEEQTVSSSTPLPVSPLSQMARASADFTRPSDTTGYAALDVVSNSTSAPAVLTFSDLGRVAAGSGYIVKARLMTSQTTNTARYRLHLYNESITAINDNAPFTMLYANRAKRVGFVDFTNLTTEGTGSTAANGMNVILRLPFVCSTGDDNLYGILETLDTFTPASAQTFFVELTADQN